MGFQIVHKFLLLRLCDSALNLNFDTCVADIKIIRLSLKKRDLETYSHCPVLTILGRPLTPFTSWNCPKSFGSGTSVEESNINITSQYESYKKKHYML